MTANTEPIFIQRIFLESVRLQTGAIIAPNLAVGLTGQGINLLRIEDTEQGALVTDLWIQPLGAIGAGSFLRIFFSSTIAGTINLLSEVPIAASSGSPLARQELGTVLPELLSPTQTGVAGKKRGLYVPPSGQLTLGLSGDLAVPIVVSIQGGYY
jgi:hypothetical protein